MTAVMSFPANSHFASLSGSAILGLNPGSADQNVPSDFSSDDGMSDWQMAMLREDNCVLTGDKDLSDSSTTDTASMSLFPTYHAPATPTFMPSSPATSSPPQSPITSDRAMPERAASSPGLTVDSLAGSSPYDKPPYSFPCMIGMALKASASGNLCVREIYAYIVKNFPYYLTAKSGWKNSVRHNLSLNKYFTKVESKDSPSKSSLWTIAPMMHENLDRDIKQCMSRFPARMRRRPDTMDAVAGTSPLRRTVSTPSVSVGRVGPIRTHGGGSMAGSSSSITLPPSTSAARQLTFDASSSTSGSKKTLTSSASSINLSTAAAAAATGSTTTTFIAGKTLPSNASATSASPSLVASLASASRRPGMIPLSHSASSINLTSSSSSAATACSSPSMLRTSTSAACLPVSSMSSSLATFNSRLGCESPAPLSSVDQLIASLASGSSWLSAFPSSSSPHFGDGSDGLTTSSTASASAAATSTSTSLSQAFSTALFGEDSELDSLADPTFPSSIDQLLLSSGNTSDPSLLDNLFDDTWSM